MKTRLAFVFVVAVGALLGCSESSGNYSKELSTEVPKPQEKGPDFGAFKPQHPLPGSKGDAAAKADGPKTINKGG